MHCQSVPVFKGLSNNFVDIADRHVPGTNFPPYIVSFSVLPLLWIFFFKMRVNLLGGDLNANYIDGDPNADCSLCLVLKVPTFFDPVSLAREAGLSTGHGVLLGNFTSKIDHSLVPSNTRFIS